MTLTRKVIKSWSAVVTYVGATEGKALVDRVMTSVKGGVLESAVIMRVKLDEDGLTNIATYQNWARTTADAPALINSELGTAVTSY